MLAIVDYGVGNLFSLRSSFGAIGAEAVVTDRKEVLARADKIVLPGVGAFGDAVQKLNASGLRDAVIGEAGQGKPLLGICLGMQLLFEKSYEFGECDGLGLIEGCVRPIKEVIPATYKIPHIGWNSLILKQNSPLFKYTKDGDHVYFVHSYYAACGAENVLATTEYGAELTAAVQKGNVYGCQFHPEKSGNVGLAMIKAFCEVKA